MNTHEFDKYYSNAGLATRTWGPPGWFFLFACIMGGYPPRLNDTREHKLIKQHFKNMLLSLQYTMPCVFCRKSFQQFIKEIPIQKYLSGRIELMFWLYMIKDKVNKKLIHQERDCYNNEKKRLKANYHKGELTESEYYQLITEFKKNTFITKPSPPFHDVLEKYEQLRATCSKKAKTCSLPKSK